MGDLAQDGSNPQPTNPGTETPAGQAPGSQPSTPPEAKPAEVGPDYKSFFEEHMSARAREQAEIQSKLQDSKISREEKLNLRERDIQIREELLKYGANKSQPQAPDLSFVPEAKRSMLQETLSKVSPEEAAAIMDFTRQLYDGVAVQPGAKPPEPANLDTNKGGVPPGKDNVTLDSASILGVGVDQQQQDAARAGFWEFLGQLKS